ncbi:uncharacterized protein TNCV_2909781 [Trichonephila clavipes]|nr:uncharacterized protein TNCV_2909781 [Trichonephila clavipes]
MESARKNFNHCIWERLWKITFLSIGSIKIGVMDAVKTFSDDVQNEYENLGHMEEVKEDILPNPHYYIPHQAVLRPDESTTKLRVAFNASAKTSNGISLNDTLLKGGAIQNELWCAFLRFR